MSHTRVWSEITPADTDLAKNGARDMRYVRVDLKERLALEHSMAADDNDGRHLEGTGRFYVQETEPTPPVGFEEGCGWLNPVTNVLKIHNGTSFVVGISLSYGVGVLASDVPMTDHGVWYVGPSVSLAIGTWLVIANLCIYTPGGAVGAYQGSLYATDIFASGTLSILSDSTTNLNMSMSGVVVLGAPTIVSARAIRNSVLSAGSLIYSLSNGSSLAAVKIA